MYCVPMIRDIFSKFSFLIVLNFVPKFKYWLFLIFLNIRSGGDILRISPWTLITSHPYPLPYDLYFNIQTIVPTLWYITFYLYFSMTPMNNNKLLIMFYWVPMITTGELFQFFIFYGTHQTRTENCKKLFFMTYCHDKNWKNVPPF